MRDAIGTSAYRDGRNPESVRVLVSRDGHEARPARRREECAPEEAVGEVREICFSRDQSSRI